MGGTPKKGVFLQGNKILQQGFMFINLIAFISFEKQNYQVPKMNNKRKKKNRLLIVRYLYCKNNESDDIQRRFSCFVFKNRDAKMGRGQSISEKILRGKSEKYMYGGSEIDSWKMWMGAEGMVSLPFL